MKSIISIPFSISNEIEIPAFGCILNAEVRDEKVYINVFGNAWRLREKRKVTLLKKGEEVDSNSMLRQVFVNHITYQGEVFYVFVEKT